MGHIVECQICGKKGHSALDCHHRNNFAYQGAAPSPTLTAMQAQTSQPFLPNDSWIVDIGASHHMIADINSMQQVTSYEGSDKITIGNGEGLSIEHVGSAKFEMLPHSIILRSVLHVPDIVVTLLYVKQLCKDNHWWFICDDMNFYVQDKVTRAVIYHGRSSDGELFRIPVKLISKGIVKAT